MTVNPIPEGFHTLTPHLNVSDGAGAIDFYKKAFGAEEINRHLMPDGKKIMHALLQIGSSRFMLNDEFPEMMVKGPKALGGTPVTLALYVADVDALFSRAVAAGATVAMPLTDMFWGDRYAQVTDPFGHKWELCQHIEDVTPEESARRAAKLFGGQGGKDCAS